MARKFTAFPRPRYAPELTPGYLNELEEIERVARAAGISELQPWQRYVIERATQYQLDDDGLRRYLYKRVMITVPRQSGKTYMLTPLRLHRMLINRGARLFATAQTGKAARDRMLQMIELVEDSPLGAVCKFSRANGGEGISIPGTRSQLRAFAPVESAVHGDTPLHVDFDEIWRYSAALGNALVNAASPAQVTLHGRAQMWFISTMGTYQSEFMNAMVEAGRAGSRPGLAYFEWSLPDGADPYDQDVWHEFHPALGNTMTLEALKEEADDLTEGDWLRSYCNRLTEASESLVDLAQWADMIAPDDDPIPAPADIAVGLEVAPESACAAFVAAWRTTGGRPRVHVLHQAPGTGWVQAYAAMLKAAGFASLIVDDHGPTRRFIPDLTGARALRFDERRLADQTLIAAARDEGTLLHDGSRPLLTAQSNARVKRTNGMDLIDRDRSTAPVPSLIAASLALYGYDHPPAGPVGLQMF